MIDLLLTLQTTPVQDTDRVTVPGGCDFLEHLISPRDGADIFLVEFVEESTVAFFIVS